MELKPLDTPDLIARAAGWLAQKEISQWLDFGDGSRTLGPAWLTMMARSDAHLLRCYTADDQSPIGLIALSPINHAFKSATVWAALGDTRYARSGYTTRALSHILTLGFRDLGLHSINTWIVEHNPSVRIAERANFRYIGRLRQCHWIDGRPCDRLLFDLLASEHKGSEQ